MAYPRVAGFSSVIPPEHHRHHTLHAAWRFVSKSSLSHHSKTNQPLSLAYRCTAEHGSTGAGRHELFSSGLHGPPPMSLIRARGRDHTLIPSCKAHAEKSLAGEYASLPNKDRVARIRKQLLEPELSPSPYDTAWVAMVSLPGSPNVPCFPQCVEWILQNQRDNGSWGINEFDPSANKGILSSALACVIALKKWNVGSEHLRRGLHFIGRNFSVVLDEQITAPVGFNITFPGMLSLAIGMGLEFPISQSRIDEILHLREMELKRQAGEDSHGEQAYMAYIVEGLGNLQDWDKVMKFQRRNGSLFNSPSATAATLIYNYDDKALQYLISLVTEFGSAVPTVHPLKLHCQISIVDSLERTGLSQHFSSEIKGILDITYRLWLQRDDEIILDVATCAMAFRLLRMNGYEVSSDELSHISEASTFHNSLQGYLNETKPILELYKASKVGLSEEDLILDNIGHWSSSLLKEMLSSSEVQTTPTLEQVEYALKFPFYATLDRLDHRRNIEYFDAGGSQMLKAEYLPSHVHQDILALAVEDFNFSQSMYQNELQHLDSWLKENRLDQLQFARQKLSYCYLSAASTIFTPELFDARISWCKSATLAGIVDDLFDVGGSKEELKNLIALVEKWDEHHACEFYSEQVKIVFSALYTTVNHLGAMASAIQGRDVTEHLREIWLQLIRSHMTEAEWKWNKYVPTMEEYMTNGFVSFACGPILFTPMYFVGQKLSDYIVKHQESNELFRLMSTCGRLLNDIKGFERDEEGNEAKLNNVSLLVLHSGGSMSIKEAKREMQKPIDTSRRDLIRLVLRDRSVVPRPCKELFWNMCKICHVYYSRTDGYSSPNEMVGAVNAVIIEPLKLQHRNTPSAIPSES